MHSLRADLWVEHDLRSPVPTRGHVLGQEACVVVLWVGYPCQAEVTDLRVAPKVRGHEPEVFLFKSFSTKPHKPPLRSDNLCSSQSSEATRNRGGEECILYWPLLHFNMPFFFFEHYKSVMLQVPGATDAFMRGFLHITPSYSFSSIMRWVRLLRHYGWGCSDQVVKINWSGVRWGVSIVWHNFLAEWHRVRGGSVWGRAVAHTLHSSNSFPVQWRTLVSLLGSRCLNQQN